uniref:Sulfotransferase n=1 Tax=Scleropages formosus TaxID=113540 RepID=A0A8C9RG45_SCLFO
MMPPTPLQHLSVIKCKRVKQGVFTFALPALKNVNAPFWDYNKLKNATPRQERPVTRSRSKTHIYVHATWRTGSSFLGELFNQHPDVFYLYEPMWQVWQALYPGDARSLQGGVRDMMSALFRCDFSALRLYMGTRNLSIYSVFGWKTNKVICSEPLCAHYRKCDVQLVDEQVCAKCPPKNLADLERECRKYPVVVIKDVRIVDLEALLPLIRDPELNLHVLQLFRDPRAVHCSRLVSKHALLKESIQILRTRRHQGTLGISLGRKATKRADLYVGNAIELICDHWHKDMGFVKDAPAWVKSRYAFVRYEDLALGAAEELRRLYRFANLRSSQALEEFAFNMTHGEKYSLKKPFLISSRDAKESMFAWRNGLSVAQISLVEQRCGQVMRSLGYQNVIVGEG